MTLGGWVVMLLSVGGVTAWFSWCVYQVLHEPGATRKMHSQIDIDTRDRG